MIWAEGNKEVVLGTALWGWGIEKEIAFQMLDMFVACGGRFIDTATNYPINQNANDYGLAIDWISEWLSNRQSNSVYVLVKIGSVDNMGGSDVNLEFQNVLQTVDTLKVKLGSALSCVSVHWDDRNQVDRIEETLEAFKCLSDAGLNIGLSGVKYPELYYRAFPSLADNWIIQVKENVLTNQARKNYEPYFSKARFFAYGINMGGVKSESSDYTSSLGLRNIVVSESLIEKLKHFLLTDRSFSPHPKSLNELALAYSYTNPCLSGVIIGPRNVKQLEETMHYWRELIDSDVSEMIVESYFNELLSVRE